MCPSEAEAVQPGLPAEPRDDPVAPSGAAPADIDLDACELDALELFLDTNDSELHRFADGCPRRVPPKARRSRERLAWALLERWAWPDCRAYLAERLAATDIRVELERRGLEALPEVAGFFPPNALLWWAYQPGITPQQGPRMCEQNMSRVHPGWAVVAPWGPAGYWANGPTRCAGASG